jgi:hypothetical protein
VAKAYDSKVDSKYITGANVSVAKVDKKLSAKPPKKKSVPRKKSALHKKKEEDLVKQTTRRNLQKKTVVSNTIVLEPDKLATALAPVQPDNEGTAMQSMMLRKRKTFLGKAEMMDKKR